MGQRTDGAGADGGLSAAPQLHRISVFALMDLAPRVALLR
jgi:hypothetical protein